MTNIFYDHLIVYDKIVNDLNHHNLAISEHQEILSIIDQHIHHIVLDTILTHLPKDNHNEFLTQFHQNPADKGHFDYLKRHGNQNIEELLKTAITAAIDDINEEIKLASKPKQKVRK